MAQLAAAVLSAVLMWLAFPPVDIGVLAFVAPAPLLWALKTTEKPGQAAWIGFVYGALFSGATIRWIILLGTVAWLPLTIGWAGYAAAFAVPLWAAGRYLPPTRYWVATMGIWSLWEFWRARWPFGGLPWAELGTPVGSMAWPRGAAQWIGASGWTVVAVGVATALVLVITDVDKAKRPLQISLGATALLTILGALFAPSADGDPVRVAIVQGGSPCPRVHCLNENQLIYNSHLALTQEIQDRELDLIVWAENSTGDETHPYRDPSVFATLAGEAARLDAYFMVSGTRIPEDQPDRFINSNILLNRRGDILGEYLKRHPVPFGEYVPYRDQLGFISALDAVPRDMIRGDRAVVFDLPEGVLGSVISFEGAFARSVRDIAKEGAELLVVTSNEGSYGRTEASDQFLGLTRMRAAEAGTPMVHAAITGKSTFISADGSYGDTTRLFVPSVIVGEVRWRTAGPTLYTRLGDWVAYVSMIGAAVAAVLPRDRRTPLRFTPPWARPSV